MRQRTNPGRLHALHLHRHGLLFLRKAKATEEWVASIKNNRSSHGFDSLLSERKALGNKRMEEEREKAEVEKQKKE
jgi:hypothetical protein